MKCKYCKYYIPDGAACCGHCGAYQGKIPHRWVINIGILATVIMALSIAIQSGTLNRQTNTLIDQTNIIKKSFEVENRPYLYLNIVPLAFSRREKQEDGTEYDNLYLGGKLTYKNVGKVPASNIESTIYFYNDADEGNNFERLKNWFIKERGAFAEPTAVFPQQEGQELIFNPDCGEGAKNFFFTIRIEYTGENPDKLYWYAADVWYLLKNDYNRRYVRSTHGVEHYIDYGVSLISSESNYDKDGKIKMSLPLTRQEFLAKLPNNSDDTLKN